MNTTLAHARDTLTSSWLNVLLLAAPVSWLLAWQGGSPMAVFAAAAISLIPAAGLIGAASSSTLSQLDVRVSRA